MKRLLKVSAMVFMLTLLCACATPNISEKGSFGENDLIFELNNKKFYLDGDASVLLRELGEKYSYSEACSCLYNGNDKTFEYTGISIYTYPLDGKDLIDEIQLTDSTYSTTKGICVGSTIEDIIATYGADYIDESGVITYRLAPDDMNSPCIYFMNENGLITGISFYSASNM